MSNSDPFNLQRFVEAQGPVFEDVRSELRAGAKVSHWMWFIFPQIRGLGSSTISDRFALTSREEAKAYSNHPVLGQRLRECIRLALAVEGKSITEILGYIDGKKFRSSMTLFAEVSPEDQIFQQALRKYFGGVPDFMTLHLL
ncbi:MAG: DUF1810 domain-containing protein [Candidatus Sulfotelmatobacter sp.]